MILYAISLGDVGYGSLIRKVTGSKQMRNVSLSKTFRELSACRRSSVAEQGFCKPQVEISVFSVGSSRKVTTDCG